MAYRSNASESRGEEPATEKKFALGVTVRSLSPRLIDCGSGHSLAGIFFAAATIVSMSGSSAAGTAPPCASSPPASSSGL